jgi:hypothetical protein
MRLGKKDMYKIVMVEWNGMSFNFSWYEPNFDGMTKEILFLLTHTIMVQFPNLNEIFCNSKAFTHMAIKIISKLIKVY